MARKYPVLSSVNLADQALIWSATNSMWALTSFSSILALVQENITTPEIETQYYSPQATDFSITIGADIDAGSDIHLILTPGADYAAGTFILPISSSLVDKQTIIVNSIKAVTAVSFDNNGASNIMGHPTTLAANGYFTLKYDMTMQTWYRIG